jgi:hypothetical protein
MRTACSPLDSGSDLRLLTTGLTASARCVPLAAGRAFTGSLRPVWSRMPPARDLAGQGAPVRLTATTVDPRGEDGMQLAARAVIWLHVTEYRDSYAGYERQP